MGRGASSHRAFCACQSDACATVQCIFLLCGPQPVRRCSSADPLMQPCAVGFACMLGCNQIVRSLCMPPAAVSAAVMCRSQLQQGQLSQLHVSCQPAAAWNTHAGGDRYASAYATLSCGTTSCACSTSRYTVNVQTMHKGLHPEAGVAYKRQIDKALKHPSSVRRVEWCVPDALQACGVQASK